MVDYGVYFDKVKYFYAKMHIFLTAGILRIAALKANGF